MLYGNYTFTCRMKTHAVLPQYKGSTFRGVFGHALKRIVCPLKRMEECGTCVLKRRCVYAVVFETPVAVTLPEGARISEPPHPFVIEPPLTPVRHFEPGDRLECGMVLFGEAVQHLPYFVYAFEQMGDMGMGKRVQGKRARFVLESVRDGEQKIYSAEDRTLHRHLAPQCLNLPAFAAGKTPHRSTRLSITIETPLRLKFNSRLKADLPFHVLVRAMLRRLSSLYSVWDGGEPDLDYRGLISRAEKIRTSENHLRWWDWRRYSNRQERKMFMGGMAGRVTYEGDLEEYLPLIRFSEKVHLGKNTSFGLGKLKAEFH